MSHYKNAPIVEAIIDLRVQLQPNIDLAALERVRINEEGTYPRKNKTITATGEMEVGVRVSASATSEETGFRFLSDDGKRIWQSRRDGFTFSQLAPYDCWQSFRDEACRLWNRYRETVQPSDIQRLAVRYINRFDIPGRTIDLKQYFLTSPEVSASLPQDLAGFFLQLQLPMDDIRSKALINETIVPPARDGVVSVVLDIDLIRHLCVPQDETAIWQAFEELRSRKNEVFEACITDEARRLIN